MTKANCIIRNKAPPWRSSNRSRHSCNTKIAKCDKLYCDKKGLKNNKKES